MLSLRDFWRRHRRKVLITTGVLGSGYFLYKLYNAHKRNLDELERQLVAERENEEFLKAQMQAHFESIQKIADTITLPREIHYLSSHIEVELPLSHLIEQLQKGKDQPDSLSAAQKIELWNKLKISSFTRMVVSIWTATMISLYIRVQVNILGRHLYIDIARGIESSNLLEDVDLVSREDEQKFLASADFLANNQLLGLISSFETAVSKVLGGKELRDSVNTTTLNEVMTQIFDLFMSSTSPTCWVDYLMPEGARLPNLAMASSNADTTLASTSKFDELMMEAQSVISSAEFSSIAERSVKAVMDALVDDMSAQTTGGSLSVGMPLAKLLPRVRQMCPFILQYPTQNPYLQLIRTIPEVELFFTLLYANTSTTIYPALHKH